MPDGRLTLRVLEVHGKPVSDPVDVFLRNLSLGDAPAFRGLDVRKTRILTGLNIFPNGRYSLEVDGLSYHAVSRFVSIPPDGASDVTITLPVNPNKVLRVNFPPFGSPAISSDAWDLLRRSANVLNFEGKSGPDLYGSLDDLRKAGFLNLVAKANRTRFPAADRPRSVLSFIEELTELRGDRFFAKVPPQLPSEARNGVQAGLFHEVDDLLHDPPAGFTRADSFKTFDRYGNLQLSFFSNGRGQFAVDMDIDDAQGFEHIFQVIGNFFGGPTHPYNIHEILIASQEVDPGYDLIVHGAAQAAA